MDFFKAKYLGWGIFVPNSIFYMALLVAILIVEFNPQLAGKHPHLVMAVSFSLAMALWIGFMVALVALVLLVLYLAGVI